MLEIDYRKLSSDERPRVDLKLTRGDSLLHAFIHPFPFTHSFHADCNNCCYHERW